MKKLRCIELRVTIHTILESNETVLENVRRFITALFKSAPSFPATTKLDGHLLRCHIHIYCSVTS